MPSLLASLLASRLRTSGKPAWSKTHQPGFPLSMLARDQLRQSGLSAQLCVSRFSDVLSIRLAQRCQGRPSTARPALRTSPCPRTQFIRCGSTLTTKLSCGSCQYPTKTLVFRVARRVLQGGYYIAEAMIRSVFKAG